MADWLSEWGVRQAAEEQGCPVSHGQFASYRDWGLLQGGEDGRWPPETVRRVVRIRAAEAEARPLPRRVLLLRADFAEFPVPAASVREAAIAFLPTIPHAARSMARIDDALQAFAARAGGRRAPRRGSPRPRRAEWEGLLAGLPPSHWESLVTGWYMFAGHLLPAAVRGTPAAVDDIPVEERVVLYALLDLSRPGGAPPARSADEHDM